MHATYAPYLPVGSSPLCPPLAQKFSTVLSLSHERFQSEYGPALPNQPPLAAPNDCQHNSARYAFHHCEARQNNSASIEFINIYVGLSAPRSIYFKWASEWPIRRGGGRHKTSLHVTGGSSGNRLRTRGEGGSDEIWILANRLPADLYAASYLIGNPKPGCTWINCGVCTSQVCFLV